MNELIFESIVSAEAGFTLTSLLISIGVSFLMGILISLCYMKAQRGMIADNSFLITLTMLPVVITIIIMMIGGNIASAFGLSGAFSIIRFRSAPGNPKDITYILFTMAVGLACGMGYVVYSMITAVILCVVILVLETSKFGELGQTPELLKITIPENLDYKRTFTELLEKYTLTNKLLRVKTADLGSLYVLEYSIALKKGIDEKEFIDELRCRNGNLNITLSLQPQTAVE